MYETFGGASLKKSNLEITNFTSLDPGKELFEVELCQKFSPKCQSLAKIWLKNVRLFLWTGRISDLYLRPRDSVYMWDTPK